MNYSGAGVEKPIRNENGVITLTEEAWRYLEVLFPRLIPLYELICPVQETRPELAAWRRRTFPFYDQVEQIVGGAHFTGAFVRATGPRSNSMEFFLFFFIVFPSPVNAVRDSAPKTPLKGCNNDGHIDSNTNDPESQGIKS